MTENLENTQKMFKGELSPEEMGKAHAGQKSEEDQIKALLSPDQLAEYDTYQKEEKQRMLRLTANAELMQMQGTLQLTEEQQDKVFETLIAASDKDINPGDMSSGGGVSYLKKQLEKKIEALKDVLTPEQLERYRSFQEQQIKLAESFMSGFSKGTNSANHIEVNAVISP